MTKEDFYSKITEDGARFHSILYVATKQLALNGCKEINAVDIGTFLQNYPVQLECCEDNDYISFIDSAKELGGLNNFEYNYTVVRKYSLLRSCRDAGFNINEIYDEEDEYKFSAISLEDITNFFEGRLAKICKDYNTTKRLLEYRAGENFEYNKEDFKKEPLIGSSFQSEYLNGIFRGMYGFGLRSANSGGGKTALSVGDLCKACAMEYYDEETETFVINKSRAGAGLFINTEMDLERELEPIFIAWISGVPRNHILDGKYEKGEEERVDYAGKVLRDSEIYLVDDPDFTIKSLTSTIADYALNKNVKTVVFDYIASTPALQAEVTAQTKVPQREDMILLALTDKLKQVSRKYDVCLLSGTQLNAKESEIKQVDETCLMSGKGTIRKCDYCIIMTYPTKSELEMINLLCEKKGFGNKIKPNAVMNIIKARSGKYPKYIKVFQYVDLGTGRSKDLCCTYRDNTPIKVEKLVIENG